MKMYLTRPYLLKAKGPCVWKANDPIVVLFSFMQMRNVQFLPPYLHKHVPMNDYNELGLWLELPPLVNVAHMPFCIVLWPKVQM